MSPAKPMVALCVLISAGLTEPAAAQSDGGLYVRGDVAWSLASNPNIRDLEPADGLIQTNAGDPGVLKNISSGWLAGGGGGMRFGRYLRADVVYTYRSGYSVDQTDSLPSTTRFKADLNDHAVMATGYADFPVDFMGLFPFAGIGMGWNHITLSSFSASGGVNASLPGGERNNFAWQAILGAGFPIANGIMLDIFGRYFDGGHFTTKPGNIGLTPYHGAGGTFHTYDFGVSVRVPIAS